MTDANDAGTMLTDLRTAGTYDGACSSFPGCYIIVSSVNAMGYTECGGQDSSASGCGLTTAMPGAMFAQLGGTPSASYASSSAAYSLVSTVQVNGTQVTFAGPGGGTESLGCTLTTASSGKGTTCPLRGNNGAINGVFINGAADESDSAAQAVSTGTSVNVLPLRFIATPPVTINARSVATTTGINTVTVGSNLYQSNPAIVSAGGSGFQVVILNRDTLALVANTTFSSTSTNTTENLPAMASLLTTQGYTGEDYIWIIASIGASSASASGFYQVAQAVATVGGSFSVFNQLGGQPDPSAGTCTTASDYALIGWQPPVQTATGLPVGAGLESSGGITCQTVGVTAGSSTPVNETAVMLPDQRSFYSPRTGGAAGISGSSGLMQAVLQPSSGSWPAVFGAGPGTTPTVGQATVYALLSNEIESSAGSGIPGSNGDIRYYYPYAVNTSETQTTDGLAEAWITTLKAAAYSGAGHGYSQTDFTAVKDELLVELNALSDIARFQGDMYTAYEGTRTDIVTNTSAIYSYLQAQLAANNGDPVAVDALSLFGTYVADLLPIAVPGVGEALGPALDVVSQSVAFGFGLSENTATGGPATQLMAEWGSLQSQMGNLIDGAENALSSYGQLASVDYNRLMGMDNAVEKFLSPPTVPFDGSFGAPPDLDSISAALTAGFTATAVEGFLSQQYKSVTLRALWGDAKPNVTTMQYPTVQALSPGGSIHRAICSPPPNSVNQSCGAETAGHGLNGAYFLSLSNSVNKQSQPSNGNGNYYWQTQFMYRSGSVGHDGTPTFVSQGILDLLFNDARGTAISLTTGQGTAFSLTALGLWPGFFYGTGQPGAPAVIPPATDSYDICGMTNGCGPGNQSAPGDEVLTAPGRPTTSTPPTTRSATTGPTSTSATSTSTGSALSSAKPTHPTRPAATASGNNPPPQLPPPALAATGATVSPGAALGPAAALVFLGLLMVGLARRKRGRPRRMKRL